LIEEGLPFLGKHFPNSAGFEASFQPKKSSKSDSCDIPKGFRRLASELLPTPYEGRWKRKNAVDIDGVFVVSREDWVSAATGAGGQIADMDSEIRVDVSKRRAVMKLQRMFCCITGALLAVGFVASQASAGDRVPVCDFALEINALRGGSPTTPFGLNATKNITAKARISKGSAPSGTTIETQLIIETIDDGAVIDTKKSFPITLGVGKGGQGDKLTMDIPSCSSGSIDFKATFVGDDDQGDECTVSKSINKTCK
jgi:hypothetical protein